MGRIVHGYLRANGVEEAVENVLGATPVDANTVMKVNPLSSAWRFTKARKASQSSPAPSTR